MKLQFPHTPMPDDAFRVSAGQLKMLVDVGCRGPILAGLIDLQLQSCGRPRMTADLARYVSGPVIVHDRSGDLSDHPMTRLREKIAWERAQIGLGLSPFLVSPTEIVCVLFNLCLEHPFGQTLAELYLWAGSHAASQAIDGLGPDQFWDMLNGGSEKRIEHRTRVITDAMILNEEPWHSVYRRIATDIRRKVVDHVRSRERDARGSEAPADLLAAE